MEKTQRVFVLLIAVFFVAAYLFDLRTGWLAALSAISLGTLFQATFGGLGRLRGYDSGQSNLRLTVFLLTGLAGIGALWVQGGALLAGSLLAGSFLAGAVAFAIARN